nr:MAG TPA: hypothetical protein [Caudoviricetes sp.]
MLICVILWLIWLVWAIFCFTILKNSDKDWHVILFWLLLTMACGSMLIWLLVEHPLYFWLLCKH